MSSSQGTPRYTDPAKACQPSELHREKCDLAVGAVREVNGWWLWPGENLGSTGPGLFTAPCYPTRPSGNSGSEIRSLISQKWGREERGAEQPRARLRRAGAGVRTGGAGTAPLVEADDLDGAPKRRPSPALAVDRVEVGEELNHECFQT